MIAGDGGKKCKVKDGSSRMNAHKLLLLLIITLETRACSPSSYKHTKEALATPSIRPVTNKCREAARWSNKKIQFSSASFIHMLFLWLERTMDRVAAVRVANMMIVCRSVYRVCCHYDEERWKGCRQLYIVIDAKTALRCGFFADDAILHSLRWGGSRE